MTTKNNDSAPTRERAAQPAKEKQQAIAFVNWEIPNPNDPDKPLLRSSKGYSLFDNQFLTREDKALIKKAREGDGTALIPCVMRVVIREDKPEIDTDAIPTL